MNFSPRIGSESPEAPLRRVAPGKPGATYSSVPAESGIDKASAPKPSALRLFGKGMAILLGAGAVGFIACVAVQGFARLGGAWYIRPLPFLPF